MATIEDQAAYYMAWFVEGMRAADGEDRPKPMPIDGDAAQRGFDSGRAAYLAAERAERERLEAQDKCDACLGSGKSHPRYKNLDCEVCHGTGKRT